MSVRPIRRALISVYDKTGIVDFARALHEEFGIEIISTGGTARLLKENGIPVTLVEEITGFPEMLDGRVKTLHPKIHAAILADRDNPEHMRQLAEQGIEPIDMVVVNLYPFKETIAKPDCTFEEAIEMIDIGGPCLLRAAAKNHKHVLTVSKTAPFDNEIRALRNWDNDPIRLESLQSSAGCAFWDTEEYDAEVATWFANTANYGDLDFRVLRLLCWGGLRYGENPHQTGVLTSLCDPTAIELTAADNEWEGDSSNYRSTVELSFNNYIDASAAAQLCSELSRATARCGTGFQPVKAVEECGTGLQPVSKGSTLKRIDYEKHTRRNLPHIQTPGKVYFITFRLKGPGQLDPDERTIVFEACHFWNGKKLDLHAVVVMPDHVHLLVTPKELAHDQWVSLSEIVHSIKRHTARQINLKRGRQGPLWLDECFDRIMRNEKEFCETADYIANNPLQKGLTDAMDYPWWWDEEHHKHRLKTGATLAIGATRESSATRDSGATPESSATPDSGATRASGAAPTHSATRASHRLQTGATQKDAFENECGTGLQPLKGAASCVFIKHTNACGAATATDPVEAYRRAYLGDPNAAMGGILAVDFTVDAEFAAKVMETYQWLGKPLKDSGAKHAPGGFFVEVWLAPSFDVEAVKVIRGLSEAGPAKDWGKRVRLLDAGDMSEPPHPDEMDYKRIPGGFLSQSPDLLGLNEDQWKVVTDRQPTESEMSDLRLAWLIAKHTKSNAISICSDGMLIGNGAGQMSRVMSCRIATWLAAENGHAEKLNGSAAASDAFFPFRDGPDILIDAGVRAIIQPGGSKRDADVIAACNERGVAMIFTGTRHFRH